MPILRIAAVVLVCTPGLTSGALGAQTVDFSPARLDATQPVPGRLFTLTLSYPKDPGASYALALDRYRRDPPLRFPGVGELGLAASGAFLVVAIGSLNSMGQATYSIALPPIPGLAGLTVYFQAIITTSKSPGGGVLSNLYVADITRAGTHTLVANKMLAARAVHSAVLLQDGRVLVVGGGSGSFSNPVLTSITEIYYPWTKRFDATRDGQGNVTRLNRPRTLHTATLLDDGRVLIAGGTGDGVHVLAHAEVFNPRTGLFTTVGPMVTARAAHTATRLPDGRVLIAGGTSAKLNYPGMFAGITAATEIFDPRTNTFKAGPSMRMKRMGHEAAVLRQGGRDYVVMVGGVVGLIFNLFPYYTWSAEAFDTVTGAFSSSLGGHRIGIMNVAIAAPSVAVQRNGRLLVVGGVTGALPHAVTNVSELDPATGRFTAVSPIPTERARATVVALPDGRVLVEGGALGSVAVPRATASCYLYANGAFKPTGSLSTPRGAHTATVLPGGAILVIGGGKDARTALDTAEFYTP